MQLNERQHPRSARGISQFSLEKSEPLYTHAFGRGCLGGGGRGAESVAERGEGRGGAGSRADVAFVVRTECHRPAISAPKGQG